VPAEQPLSEKLSGATAVSLLLEDFEARFEGGAISPEDMPRNRIYPVGGAQCYLLDFLGVDWRPAAQRGDDGFSYVNLLRDRLAVKEEDLGSLVASAKRRCGYEDIKSAMAIQVEKYGADFAAALTAFESQPGQRLEVTLSTNGLSRSRVSAARKWLIDEGRRSLCSQYNVYVLKRSGIRLQVESSGVLELNDWERRMRTAVCYVGGHVRVTIDNAPTTLEDGRTYHFSRMAVHADKVSLECSTQGAVRRSGDRLVVDFGQ
jgi:hypothetical protein